MSSYLMNNLALIHEYQHLYKDGIDIDALIRKFRAGELITHSGSDYGRFRIFIDSCMLLLNREKLNFYAKGQFNFKEFFDGAKNDAKLQPYLQYIKSNYPLTANISGVHLYYSLDGIKKTPWDEVATIRNAMAHMQYGFFASQKNGLTICYSLYNKDKGVRKDWGIVFEPILHNFIHRFFSNYGYGILFKYTGFSTYSFKKERTVRTPIYYEVTCKNENMNIYNGYNTNLMQELLLVANNPEKLFPFLYRNREKFDVKEVPIRKVINMRRFKKLEKRVNFRSQEERMYGIKTFLDFEAELSNFLVHIDRLNEVLYNYCVTCSSNSFPKTEISSFNSLLEQALLELKEDERAKFAFELGFVYLQAMNFLLRTEDDDCEILKYSDVDVAMFAYDNAAFQKYASTHGAEDCSLQKYIVEKMRNALMHGHIGISLSKKSEVLFCFTDVYNKRSEKIEVSFDDLKFFLSQECLYNGVPQETESFII